MGANFFVNRGSVDNDIIQENKKSVGTISTPITLLSVPVV